jgi:hypothetical protein
MGINGKERHLAFRIPAIGAMGIGLDEFPNGKAIHGFVGRDGSVFTHK